MLGGTPRWIESPIVGSKGLRRPRSGDGHGALSRIRQQPQRSHARMRGKGETSACSLPSAGVPRRAAGHTRPQLALVGVCPALRPGGVQRASPRSSQTRHRARPSSLLHRLLFDNAAPCHARSSCAPSSLLPLSFSPINRTTLETRCEWPAARSFVRLKFAPGIRCGRRRGGEGRGVSFHPWFPHFFVWWPDHPSIE